MSRLEAVTARLEKLEGAAPAQAGAAAPAQDGEVPKAQQAFIDLIEEYLKPQVEAGKKFDETLGKCMEDFLEIANQIAALIGVAAKSKKPSQEQFQKMIQPISAKMCAVGEYKDKNFKSPYINYFSALAEAAPVFGWICVEKTPAPYASDMIPGAEFYTNKILVATKGKEQDKFDWAINVVKFLKEMVPYIKTYHTTGLTWNPNGADAQAELPKAEAPKQEAPKPAAEKPKANTAGLFAELNKGTGISGGLKHVTSDMKTKNMKPEDKKPLEPKAAPKPAAKAAPKQAVQKPPKMEKNGNKWDISYQVDNNSMEIEGEFKDSVYIFKCEKSTVRIKGKINLFQLTTARDLLLFVIL